MIDTQLGWLSRDALIASSRNRLIMRASADSSSLRILTATVRPSAIWSARYTAPLPPIPMHAVSLNLSPRTRPTSLSDLLTWSCTWLLTRPTRAALENPRTLRSLDDDGNPWSDAMNPIGIPAGPSAGRDRRRASPALRRAMSMRCATRCPEVSDFLLVARGPTEAALPLAPGPERPRRSPRRTPDPPGGAGTRIGRSPKTGTPDPSVFTSFHDPERPGACGTRCELAGDSPPRGGASPRARARRPRQRRVRRRPRAVVPGARRPRAAW